MKKLLSIITVLTFSLSTTLYAANQGTSTPTTPLNKSAMAVGVVSAGENTEQYKLTLTKDANVLAPHVELLPDENNEYWIPKNYNIKITSDCKDGYQQSSPSGSIEMIAAKNIGVTSEVAPPINHSIKCENIGSGNYFWNVNDAQYILPSKYDIVWFTGTAASSDGNYYLNITGSNPHYILNNVNYSSGSWGCKQTICYWTKDQLEAGVTIHVNARWVGAFYIYGEYIDK